MDRQAIVAELLAVVGAYEDVPARCVDENGCECFDCVQIRRLKRVIDSLTPGSAAALSRDEAAPASSVQYEMLAAQLRGYQDFLSGQPPDQPYREGVGSATHVQLNFAWTWGYDAARGSDLWREMVRRADRAPGSAPPEVETHEIGIGTMTEAPYCHRHGAMRPADEMGRVWHCDLCAAEVETLRADRDEAQAEHTRAVLLLAVERHELAAARAALAELHRLIDDDAYAITFQSIGQYRRALLRAVLAGSAPTGEKGEQDNA